MDNYLTEVLGLMFGVYLIIKSYARYAKLTEAVENGVETKGKIALVKKESRLLNDAHDEDGSYKTVYYPVVEYIDGKGNELVCELVDEYSTSEHNYKIGDVIALFYDKDKPHLAVSKSNTDLKWIALIPLTLGMFVFAYCAFMLIDYFRA